MPPKLKEIEALLLDIEGTTTSISFVKDELFPYARKHLNKFISDNWEQPDLKRIFDEFKLQNASDINEGLSGVPLIPTDSNDHDVLKASLIVNVLWQMDNDRKTTPLKSLQGLIWLSGYGSGELNGHIYDDVPLALKAWKSLGKRIYIYSSGSIQAQKLLFGHSSAGDLTQYLDGFFDTTIGPKMESSSYQKICHEINAEPGRVLFLTDIPKEAYAASASKVQVLLVRRHGNAPLSQEDLSKFSTIESFEEISCQD